MKRTLLTIIMVLLLVTMTACAARPHQTGETITSEEKPAGFWLGLWHGLIAPVTLLISLFNHNVAAFETYNNGAWYVSGFVFGLILYLGVGNNSRKNVWHRNKKSMTIKQEKTNVH